MSIVSLQTKLILEKTYVSGVSCLSQRGIFNHLACSWEKLAMEKLFVQSSLSLRNEVNLRKKHLIIVWRLWQSCQLFIQKSWVFENSFWLRHKNYTNGRIICFHSIRLFCGTVLKLKQNYNSIDICITIFIYISSQRYQALYPTI